ncbi:putative HLH DNA binding domain protein [Aspergillus clavatus NRRL 1]|uniref:HLH DNA binding domain protein, putative n=1 Tax=Aspergillus clavatus (strain ATCC 1007 / CBS 513.65 / DSM 816 / NCTC 3887 / NRRL 1 / QM 1276 / 107) TaxID=344612 RepID=A1C9D6_ASPCL|nr:HLH DNA binding domain protein, putative [Aspergillus clavatus NRRL 1]EAW13460.1 HLH DNA binding domain protein, putative [Aspergillus clavatus NRRL 1]
MAYNRPDAAMAFFDEDRFVPQQPKGPDPLSANWSYDSAIDLFSLNTMLPETFPMDVPNDMLLDPKDFPVDLFAPPADISGFAISHSGEDSVSSDLESDDQLWSPAYRVSSLDSAPDAQAVSPRTVEKSNTRRRTTTATTTQKPREVPRWSSSPEITPQEYSIPAQMISPTPAPAPASPAPSSRKNSRSMSTDSQTASGRNAAKRAAHNIIEKRYRTNMNAKFVALEKAMSGSGVQKPTKSGSSASLKKSEILSNAISYMQELQDENAALQKELALLKQNLLPGSLWRHTKDETFRS